MPSPARREAEAAQLQSDRIASKAIASALRVSISAMAAVLAAFRAGRDIASVFSRESIDIGSALSEAMVLAALTGIQRQTNAILARLPGRQAIALAREPIFRSSIDFLTTRLRLRRSDLIFIETKASAHVVRVVADLSRHVELRLMESVRDIQIENLSTREGTKRLAKTFDRLGITPAHKASVETIFRTQTQLAFAAGQESALRDPAIDDILWGWTYVTIGDDRVRPTHAPLDGVTLPKDDPFWRTSSPPNGWNCRCWKIAVFNPRKERRPPNRVEIDGKLVIPGADQGFQFNPGDLLTPRSGVKTTVVRRRRRRPVLS